MEVLNQNVLLREDKNLIVITHLSQYLYFITGFGGLIVPLLIWLTTKDKVADMDENGKAVINFQLSLLLYIIIGIPLILFFGLGILVLVFAGILSIIMPVVNAVKANSGHSPSYFGTVRFLN